MTKKQQDQLDKGTHTLVPKWEILVRYSFLFSIATVIYSFATKEGDMTHHMSTNVIHMTLKEMQEEFPTRREYEGTLKSINNNLELLLIKKKNE